MDVGGRLCREQKVEGGIIGASLRLASMSETGNYHLDTGKTWIRRVAP